MQLTVVRKERNNMSTTNTESVLSAISSYNSENKRPCPAKFLRDTFGEVDDAIESLKASGVVIAT